MKFFASIYEYKKDKCTAPAQDLAFIINAYAPELDEWCIYKYTRSHAVDLCLLSA